MCTKSLKNNIINFVSPALAAIALAKATKLLLQNINVINKKTHFM